MSAASAGLLREQGNLDELRRRADAGDGSAARELVRLLREQGNLEEAAAVLRRRADAGDWSAPRGGGLHGSGRVGVVAVDPSVGGL